MIFPRINEVFLLNKVARIELSLANLQLFMRVTAFSIFYKFLKSRNRKSAFFSLLRNLIIPLHLKFLPKLRNKL